jgi:hypothetical protein
LRRSYRAAATWFAGRIERVVDRPIAGAIRIDAGEESQLVSTREMSTCPSASGSSELIVINACYRTPRATARNGLFADEPRFGNHELMPYGVAKTSERDTGAGV